MVLFNLCILSPSRGCPHSVTDDPMTSNTYLGLRIYNPSLKLPILTSASRTQILFAAFETYEVTVTHLTAQFPAGANPHP